MSSTTEEMVAHMTDPEVEVDRLRALVEEVARDLMMLMPYLGTHPVKKQLSVIVGKLSHEG